MDPPPRQETAERQAQAWRHVVGRNGTGNVEQHLITNGVDSVARLARTAQTTRDFMEFVVRPYLDVVGVKDDLIHGRVEDGHASPSLAFR